MVLGLRWQTVAEIFPQEQENHLKERARPPYGCYRIVQTAVNSYCLVNFEGNRYSTPCHLVRRQVSLHVYLDKIQIVDGQEVLAEHIRLYGKGLLIGHSITCRCLNANPAHWETGNRSNNGYCLPP